MSEFRKEINKLARKRSKDPEQEAIREAKDVWNSEVSDLISQLISLKKGINGRGDKEKGIPPSSIREPLPSQISSHLEETGSRSSKIMELAKRIIDHQGEYAHHVQERQHGKTALASWWGSQAYAYLRLLIKAEKVEGRLRRRLLRSAVAFENQFKQFESNMLDYNNEASVPISLSDFVSIMFMLSADFVPTFLQLKNVIEVIDDDKKKLKTETAKKPEEKSDIIPLKSSDPVAVSDPVVPDKKPDPSSPKTIITPALPEVPTELSDSEKEAVKKLEEESVTIGIVVNYLITKHKEFPPSQIKILKAQYNSFIKKLNLLLGEVNKPEEERNAPDLKLHLRSLLQIEYKNLKDVFDFHLGKVKNIKDYLTTILPTDADKKAVLDYHSFIYKQATNALERFVNKSLLSVLPNPVSKVKLDIVETSLRLRDFLDELMDDLEEPGNNLFELSRELKNVLNTAILIMDKIEQLSQIYIAETRRLDRPKSYYKVNISREDLMKLKQAKSRVEAALIALSD